MATKSGAEPNRGGFYPVRRGPSSSAWRSQKLSEIQGIARFKFHPDKVEEISAITALALNPG